MKRTMVLLAAALSLVAGAAFAGLQQPAEVIVDFDNGFASGDQYTARTSKNDVEFIGCGTRNFDDGTFSFTFNFCQASDGDGNSVVCTTENPVLINAIEEISDFAYITFSWDDDGSGVLECIRVGSSTQSFYLPNFTTKGKN